MEITQHPLYWPEGWKRNKSPENSRFGDHSIKKAIDMVLHQLHHMGTPNYMVIFSTNLKLRNDGLPYSSQKEPIDSGVSVWWKTGNKWEEQKVMAVDDYNTCSENLWAIAKTLEALRGIERWSSSEIINRTFKGFTALPPPSGGGWCVILQCDVNDFDLAKHNYMRLRSKHHSDNGGDPILYNQVQEAWKECKEHFNK